MKKLSNVILISIVLVAAFLTSCDKEIETSPVTFDKSQKGTVTGYVFANTDNSLPGYEKVAEGTKVVITMNYNELQ
jgi:hypothetical protein